MMTSLMRQTYPLANFVDRFFDDSFFAPAVREQGDVSNRSWIPAVDLSQTDSGYLVQVDLPGLTKGDITVTVENNTLTLSGERAFEKREEEESFNRIERSYGRFTRSFGLPSNVEATAVKAAFAEGVLTVEIPKTEEAKSREIKIS